MNAAKYYIYRNLRTGGFSVRYRGRVIDRLSTFTATNVQFKVNEKGRQKVIADKQKNVHAFVVTDKYKKESYPLSVDKGIEIRYNPYKNDQFTIGGLDIYSARKVIFSEGRCFSAMER